jgi:hypothetical protein
MKMSALYRQWLILKMFPPRGKVSTSTLRDRLINEYGIETTLRTIQRDLVSLESNEFPLDCDNNNPAGWSWRKDAPAFGISNREVYKSALLSSAAAIIILHNHPTGDPAPSREDIEITRRLKEAGEIIGVRLLDHIIIGDSFVSFVERGLL